MSKQLVVDYCGYRIQPDDIDASQHLWDSFGHSETEISAGWIVRFVQERNQGWTPFTYDEINAFYARRFKNGFTFNRLISSGWIVVMEGGTHHVTEDFVNCCHKSSPKNTQSATV